LGGLAGAEVRGTAVGGAAGTGAAAPDVPASPAVEGCVEGCAEIGGPGGRFGSTADGGRCTPGAGGGAAPCELLAAPQPVTANARSRIARFVTMRDDTQISPII
jgi:hypothetical protein